MGLAIGNGYSFIFSKKGHAAQNPSFSVSNREDADGRIGGIFGDGVSHCDALAGRVDNEAGGAIMMVLFMPCAPSSSHL